ncbi:unnamed protein product [Clavelina lepadiformis]|uniref:Kinase n=1 Tax=Clavelina lepadiformis TaxID=159417 RepID=A0ABP0GVJ6_CLALP
MTSKDIQTTGYTPLHNYKSVHCVALNAAITPNKPTEPLQSNGDCHIAVTLHSCNTKVLCSQEADVSNDGPELHSTALCTSTNAEGVTQNYSTTQNIADQDNTDCETTSSLSGQPVPDHERHKKRTKSDSVLNTFGDSSGSHCQLRGKRKACRGSSIPTLILSDSTGRDSCLFEGNLSPDLLLFPESEELQSDTSHLNGRLESPVPSYTYLGICLNEHQNINSDTDLTNSANGHQLLSPRRSCDSAYGSCMESVNSMPQDDNHPILFSDNDTAMDNEDNSTGISASSQEELSHGSISSLSLCLPHRSVSPFSSSSSLASDVTTDAQVSTDESSGNLLVEGDSVSRKSSFSRNFSLRSSLSFEESEEDFASSEDGSTHSTVSRRNSKAKAQSSWTKIRRMVIWSPFMQSFKKKYPWVQLAGHAGNFQPGDEGCILKKFCEREADCLRSISDDPVLRNFAPTFHGIVECSAEKYTRMQDLLLPFDCPSLMDCKMGIRTYLEDELVLAKVKPRMRHDMYQKMVEISPDEPTDEEKELRAVTKPRYMQWREHVTSTSNLGFRIEGIKKSNNDPSKDYKLTKSVEQVTVAFKYFIDDNIDVLEKYIERLKEMREALESSDFFHRHEAIGSSLLFVHDSSGLANVWMIDFGKTSRLPEDQTLDHRSQWIEGNREDGYLFGMDNVIGVFEGIRDSMKPLHSLFLLSDLDSEQNVSSQDNVNCNDVTATYNNVTPQINITVTSPSPVTSRKPLCRQQSVNARADPDDVISNDVDALSLSERTL